MIKESQIKEVVILPVILTRRNGLTCYSSHEHQDRIAESEDTLSIDEWESMLHLIAPDMRRVLIPVSDQKAPEVINMTECDLVEGDLKRLLSSYYAMWQTADPDQEESLDELAQDAVSRVAWFLQRRFQRLADQIVMDYSAQTISLI